MPADHRVSDAIQRLATRFKMLTILSTWEGHHVDAHTARCFDHVVISPDPGPSECNIARQRVSTLAGLKCAADAGMDRAIKTRSDIILSKALIAAVSTGSWAPDHLVVSNLFTRHMPFHASDMVVFGHVDVLSDVFAWDDRYPDRVAERRLYTTLALRRFPELAMSLDTSGESEAWADFCRQHLTVWDYRSLGLLWTKCERITEHEHWRIFPTSWGPDGDMALVPGQSPFASRDPVRGVRSRWQELLGR